jgi:hypothetical protein
LVGEATAGSTGSFRPHPEVDGVWILCGEIRPSPDLSLIPGGVMPRITVAMSAKDNYRAYFLYEAGTSISSLIQKENLESKKTSADHPEEHPPAALQDLVLQKGIDIVAALQILEQLPE